MKGKKMTSMKMLMTAGCLLAGLLPASAHHEATAGSGAYLAFWGGAEAPATADLAAGTCRDGGFWEKGFVSIYSHGQVDYSEKFPGTP